MAHAPAFVFPAVQLLAVERLWPANVHFIFRPHCHCHRAVLNRFIGHLLTASATSAQVLLWHVHDIYCFGKDFARRRSSILCSAFHSHHVHISLCQSSFGYETFQLPYPLSLLWLLLFARIEFWEDVGGLILMLPRLRTKTKVESVCQWHATSL